MKKLYIILALIVVSFLMVFAGDTIKILRIYHNGTFTAIPLGNIDSIDHSRYDTNGTFQANYTSSIIETLDSTYYFPINEIDSVVITNADIEEYNQHTDEIMEFLANLEELPVNQYQNKLLNWLNNCNYVSRATLTDLNDKIIIKFTSGLDFYINFIDMYNCFHDDDENEKTAEARVKREAPSIQKYIDVSFSSEEEIINPNILYLQGRSMPSKWGEMNLKSNANKEWDELYNSHNESPIEGKLKIISKSFSFIGENFSQYGLFIISQTHGDSGRSGMFQVEDKSGLWESLKSKGIKKGKNVEIYLFGDQKVCRTSKDEDYVYWFLPEYLRTRMNKILVYGSYCYSSDLCSKFGNSTIYGYNSSMWYGFGLPRKTPAKDSLIIRIDRLLNGYMYKDAVWLKPYFVNGDFQIPSINKQNATQRYFSIRTDSLTNDGEIVGRINGYDNLKKDIKWVVYVHDGSDEFKPSDEGVEEIQDVVEVKADGSFTVKSDVYYDNPWSSYIVAFKYNGKVYYGGQKYAGMCPNENHPHKRDLGLSVKWACCNVGATMPFEIGYFYQWGDNERFYEWSNKEYKYWKDNNHKECKFIGYNISGNPDHDGATHLWGKHWRMPTVAECEELLKNCVAVEYNEWYEVLGRIKGDYVFSNKNGNWMFLPYYWNSDGGYWTGNAVPENERKDMWQEIPNFAAYSLILNEPRQTGYIDYEYQPFIGQDKKVFMASIRPVYVEFADE